MTVRISEEKLTEIREAIDIVDLVGEYVQLNKQGRNYFGLCPFHGEKTPSFSVSPEKQIYHCFGCGVGGNVFSFLTEIEKISFIEAVQRLAQKGNIELPTMHRSYSNENNQSQETNKMIAAHELLRKLYHHILVNTADGEEALKYLKDRGFSNEAIDRFQIGYALPSWDFAKNFLKGRSYDEDLLERAGLLIKHDDRDNYFDRFRHRIMFPIFNNKGETIAFSGRSMDDDGPKYLNSPETPIFNKSNTLYNFNFARQAIRQQNQVVLFEGFADVIAAFDAGIENSVATMGTSLTEAHIATIRRNSQFVTICFDNDAAGFEATFRSANDLKKSGCSVRIALLPENYDPDDYLKENGPTKFRDEIIDQSLTLMAFKLQYFRQGKNLNNEGDRLRYIEEVLQEISLIKSAVEREHYLRQISEEFSISLHALMEQQKQFYFSKRNERRNDRQTLNNTFIQRSQQTLNKLKPAYYIAERHLLAHMLRNDDIAYRVKQLLENRSFNVDEHQAIFTYLLGFYEEGNNPNASSFITYLQDEKLKNTTAQIEMMEINDHLSEQELLDYVKQVFNYEKMLKIKEKEEEKRQAEIEKDFLKAAEIATEIIQIRKTL